MAQVKRTFDNQSNCDRGLETATQGRKPRAAFPSPRSQFFTIRTDAKPASNLFSFFSKLSNEKELTEKKIHASVTVTVVRDRKIRTALRTNQIVGFVTLLAWKKIKPVIFLLFSSRRKPVLRVSIELQKHSWKLWKQLSTQKLHTSIS